MRVRVTISLKPGVLDPQGAAIAGALRTLGFDGVRGARQGKIVELDIDETDPGAALARAAEMAEALLANTVIESYAVEALG